jgi:hypothetical protein
MTKRKTESQLRKGELVKVARTVLRLRYALLAERELNVVLPDLEDAFDKAVHDGKLPGQVDLKALVAGVLDEA